MKTLKAIALFPFRAAHAVWTAARFDPLVATCVVIVLIIVAVVANNLGQIQGYDQAFADAQLRKMELLDDLSAVRKERDKLRSERTRMELELESVNRTMRNVGMIIEQQRQRMKNNQETLADGVSTY